MTGTRTTGTRTTGTADADRLVADALAEARSPRPVAPDTPAGPARPRWTGDPAELTAEPAAESAARGGLLDLGRLLASSLNATPVDHHVRDAGTVSTRLRPVASAGGLHPVNAHLLVGPGCALPQGRYAYDPFEHRALRRGPAPPGSPRGTVVVLTVTAQRTASHYGHRAWPLLLLDTGHAVAGLSMAALAHGEHARLSLDAPSPLLATAAGLPTPDQWCTTWPDTAPEHPLAAVHLTVSTPPDEPERLTPSPVLPCPLTPWTAEPLPPPPAPGPAPSPAGRRAGAVLAAMTRGTTAASWRLAEPPFAGAERSPAEAIAMRRSATPPLGGEPAPADLSAVLAAATSASPPVISWCAAVGGRHPGLVTVDPAEPAHLRPIANGEARPTLAAWAAGQGWLADAGAVLIAEGLPDSAPARRIRTDYLAAGYAVACAELTATALGLGTRPVGSWQAADLGAALGDPPGRRWVIHGLAMASSLSRPRPSRSRSDHR